jgi:hypothetical protein
MADLKISQLTAISVLTPATDVLPVVDSGGVTKKITTNQILGSGGTATLASATITGAATVGTTLGVTGASTLTGNVAVGTTSSPWASTFKAVNVSTYAAFGGNNDDKLTLIANNFYNDGTGKFIGNGYASTYDQYQGTHRWQVSTTSNASGAGAAATLTRVMTADVSGNLLIGVTNTNANGGVLQLKSGITFPATQVAASDANTLDDYEEGTWTPTITFATLSVGVTYAAQAAIYTKVGRIVHFSGRIDLSSKGTSVGGAVIAGLPFAANTGAASVGFQTSIAPSGSQAMLTIDGTTLIIRYASTTTTAQSTNSDFSNSSIIIFSGTYAV